MMYAGAFVFKAVVTKGQAIPLGAYCLRFARATDGAVPSEMPLLLNLLLALLLLLGASHRVFAAEAAGPEALLAAYHELRPKLETNVYGAPIYVESAEDGERMHGEVYSVVRDPYPRLARALRSPRNWCDLVLLHLNIKACVYERQDTSEWLTLYGGRKFYEPLERSHALRYRFRLEAGRDDYFRATLAADTGPFGSSDYRIEFEAVPLGDGSFVRFRYGYRQQLLTRLATAGYLATLGSGKVGFTITGQDKEGRPEYVGGVRGIAERNAIRYYLAIQAYLDTSDLPAAERFEARLRRWFELTERYPKQLHELEQSEYLETKRKEYRQQLERQQALDVAIQP